MQCGNVHRVSSQIADCVHKHLQINPDAPLLILGFSLDYRDPYQGFFQDVKCGTRKNNILDKCYGNINDAYVAKAKAKNVFCDLISVT